MSLEIEQPINLSAIPLQTSPQNVSKATFSDVLSTQVVDPLSDSIKLSKSFLVNDPLLLEKLLNATDTLNQTGAITTQEFDTLTQFFTQPSTEANQTLATAWASLLSFLLDPQNQFKLSLSQTQVDALTQITRNLKPTPNGFTISSSKLKFVFKQALINSSTSLISNKDKDTILKFLEYGIGHLSRQEKRTVHTFAQQVTKSQTQLISHLDESDQIELFSLINTLETELTPKDMSYSPGLRKKLSKILEDDQTSLTASQKELVKSLIQGKTSLVTNDPLETFISSEAMKKFLNELTQAPPTSLSTAEKSLLKNQLEELSCCPLKTNSMADIMRNELSASSGISDAEAVFRSRTYLVSPENESIKFMINSFYDDHILTKDMSSSEIAEAILTYVQQNFDYISDTTTKDGKPLDHWQSVQETLERNGGDCEDLSILTASLLMNALKKSGYSDKEVASMVELQAGYLIDKNGNKMGHMLVTLKPDNSEEILGMDPTGDSGLYNFEDLSFEKVFSFNHAEFTKYGDITDEFTTALEVSSLDDPTSIASLIETHIQSLEELLETQVEIPIFQGANVYKELLEEKDYTKATHYIDSDGKISSITKNISREIKDLKNDSNDENAIKKLSQYRLLKKINKNDKEDFTLFSIESSKIGDINDIYPEVNKDLELPASTYEVDHLYRGLLDSDALSTYLLETQKEINKITYLLHLGNMYLEHVYNQSSEIHDMMESDAMRSINQQSRKDGNEFKGKFASKFNQYQQKGMKAITDVVTEITGFVSLLNQAQYDSARLNIDLWGREDFGRGVGTELVNELTGAFDYIREGLKEKLGEDEAYVKTHNAIEFFNVQEVMLDNINLWSDETKVGQAGNNLATNFDEDVRVVMEEIRGNGISKAYIKDQFDDSLRELKNIRGNILGFDEYNLADIGNFNKGSGFEGSSDSLLTKAGNKGGTKTGDGYFLDKNGDRIVSLSYMVTNFHNYVRTALLLQQEIHSKKNEMASQLNDGTAAESLSKLKSAALEALESDLNKHQAQNSNFLSSINTVKEGLNKLVRSQISFNRSAQQVIYKTLRTTTDLAFTVTAVALGVSSATAETATESPLIAAMFSFMLATPLAAAYPAVVAAASLVNYGLHYLDNYEAWITLFKNTTDLAYHSTMLGIEEHDIQGWHNPTTLMSSKNYGDEVSTKKYNQAERKRDNTKEENRYTLFSDDATDYFVGDIEANLYKTRNLYSSYDSTRNVTTSMPGEETELYEVSRLAAEQGEGSLVLDGVKMAAADKQQAYYFNKLRLTMLAMRIVADAMEQAMSQMFGTSKTGSLSKLKGQVEAIISTEKMIISNYKEDIDAVITASADNKEKEKKLIELSANVGKSAATLVAGAIKHLPQFTPLVPDIPVFNSIYAATVLTIETVDLINKYTWYPYSDIAADYHETDLDDNSDNSLDLSEKEYLKYNKKRDTEIYGTNKKGKANTSTENLASIFGLDPDANEEYLEEKTDRLRQINNLDELEKDTLFEALSKGSKKYGRGKDFDSTQLGTAQNELEDLISFLEVDYEEFIEARSKLNEVFTLRVIFMMLEKALYSAKQEAIRLAFGNKSSAGIVDAFMDMVDHYNQQHFSVLDDMMREVQNRVTSYNMYLGATQSATAESSALSVYISLITVTTLLKDSGKGAINSTTASTAKIITSIVVNAAIGAYGLAAQQRDLPDGRSDTLNYSSGEVEEDGEENRAEKKEKLLEKKDNLQEQKEDIKNDDSLSDKEKKEQLSEINQKIDDIDASITELDYGSVSGNEKNFGLHDGKFTPGKGKFKATGRGNVATNAGNKINAQTRYNRKFRQIQMVMELNQALNSAIQEAAGSTFGVQASGAFKDIMRGFQNLKTSESANLDAVFSAMEQKVKTFEQYMKKTQTAATQAISLTITKILTAFVKNRKEKNEKKASSKSRSLEQTAETEKAIQDEKAKIDEIGAETAEADKAAIDVKKNAEIKKLKDNKKGQPEGDFQIVLANNLAEITDAIAQIMVNAITAEALGADQDYTNRDQKTDLDVKAKESDGEVLDEEADDVIDSDDRFTSTTALENTAQNLKIFKANIDLKQNDLNQDIEIMKAIASNFKSAIMSKVKAKNKARAENINRRKAAQKFVESMVAEEKSDREIINKLRKARFSGKTLIDSEEDETRVKAMIATAKKQKQENKLYVPKNLLAINDEELDVKELNQKRKLERHIETKVNKQKSLEENAVTVSEIARAKRAEAEDVPDDGLFNVFARFRANMSASRWEAKARKAVARKDFFTHHLIQNLHQHNVQLAETVKESLKAESASKVLESIKKGPATPPETHLLDILKEEEQILLQRIRETTTTNPGVSNPYHMELQKIQTEKIAAEKDILVVRKNEYTEALKRHLILYKKEDTMADGDNQSETSSQAETIPKTANNTTSDNDDESETASQAETIPATAQDTPADSGDQDSREGNKEEKIDEIMAILGKDPEVTRADVLFALETEEANHAAINEELQTSETSTIPEIKISATFAQIQHLSGFIDKLDTIQKNSVKRQGALTLDFDLSSVQLTGYKENRTVSDLLSGAIFSGEKEKERNEKKEAVLEQLTTGGYIDDNGKLKQEFQTLSPEEKISVLQPGLSKKDAEDVVRLLTASEDEAEANSSILSDTKPENQEKRKRLLRNATSQLLITNDGEVTAFYSTLSQKEKIKRIQRAGGLTREEAENVVNTLDKLTDDKAMKNIADSSETLSRELNELLLSAHQREDDYRLAGDHRNAEALNTINTVYFSIGNKPDEMSTLAEVSIASAKQAAQMLANLQARGIGTFFDTPTNENASLPQTTSTGSEVTGTDESFETDRESRESFLEVDSIDVSLDDNSITGNDTTDATNLDSLIGGLTKNGLITNEQKPLLQQLFAKGIGNGEYGNQIRINSQGQFTNTNALPISPQQAFAALSRNNLGLSGKMAVQRSIRQMLEDVVLSPEGLTSNSNEKTQIQALNPNIQVIAATMAENLNALANPEGSQNDVSELESASQEPKENFSKNLDTIIKTVRQNQAKGISSLIGNSFSSTSATRKPLEDLITATNKEILKDLITTRAIIGTAVTSDSYEGEEMLLQENMDYESSTNAPAKYLGFLIGGLIGGIEGLLGLGSIEGDTFFEKFERNAKHRRNQVFKATQNGTVPGLANVANLILSPYLLAKHSGSFVFNYSSKIFNELLDNFNAGYNLDLNQTKEGYERRNDIRSEEKELDTGGTVAPNTILASDFTTKQSLADRYDDLENKTILQASKGLAQILMIPGAIVGFGGQGFVRGGQKAISGFLGLFSESVKPESALDGTDTLSHTETPTAGQRTLHSLDEAVSLPGSIAGSMYQSIKNGLSFGFSKVTGKDYNPDTTAFSERGPKVKRGNELYNNIAVMTAAATVGLLSPILIGVGLTKATIQTLYDIGRGKINPEENRYSIQTSMAKQAREGGTTLLELNKEMQKNITLEQSDNFRNIGDALTQEANIQMVHMLADQRSLRTEDLNEVRRSIYRHAKRLNAMDLSDAEKTFLTEGDKHIDLNELRQAKKAKALSRILKGFSNDDYREEYLGIVLSELYKRDSAKNVTLLVDKLQQEIKGSRNIEASLAGALTKGDQLNKHLHFFQTDQNVSQFMIDRFHDDNNRRTATINYTQPFIGLAHGLHSLYYGNTESRGERKYLRALSKDIPQSIDKISNLFANTSGKSEAADLLRAFDDATLGERAKYLSANRTSSKIINELLDHYETDPTAQRALRKIGREALINQGVSGETIDNIFKSNYLRDIVSATESASNFLQYQFSPQNEMEARSIQQINERYLQQQNQESKEQEETFKDSTVRELEINQNVVARKLETLLLSGHDSDRTEALRFITALGKTAPGNDLLTTLGRHLSLSTNPTKIQNELSNSADFFNNNSGVVSLYNRITESIGGPKKLPNGQIGIANVLNALTEHTDGQIEQEIKDFQNFSKALSTVEQLTADETQDEVFYELIEDKEKIDSLTKLLVQGVALNDPRAFNIIDTISEKVFSEGNRNERISEGGSFVGEKSSRLYTFAKSLMEAQQRFNEVGGQSTDNQVNLKEKLDIRANKRTHQKQSNKKLRDYLGTISASVFIQAPPTPKTPNLGDSDSDDGSEVGSIISSSGTTPPGKSPFTPTNVEGSIESQASNKDKAPTTGDVPEARPEVNLKTVNTETLATPPSISSQELSDNIANQTAKILGETLDDVFPLSTKENALQNIPQAKEKITTALTALENLLIQQLQSPSLPEDLRGLQTNNHLSHPNQIKAVLEKTLQLPDAFQEHTELLGNLNAMLALTTLSQGLGKAQSADPKNEKRKNLEKRLSNLNIYLHEYKQKGNKNGIRDTEAKIKDLKEEIAELSSESSSVSSSDARTSILLDAEFNTLTHLVAARESGNHHLKAYIQAHRQPPNATLPREIQQRFLSLVQPSYSMPPSRKTELDRIRQTKSLLTTQEALDTIPELKETAVDALNIWLNDNSPIVKKAAAAVVHTTPLLSDAKAELLKNHDFDIAIRPQVQTVDNELKQTLNPNSKFAVDNSLLTDIYEAIRGNTEFRETIKKDYPAVYTALILQKTDEMFALDRSFFVKNRLSPNPETGEESATMKYLRTFFNNPLDNPLESLTFLNNPKKPQSLKKYILSFAGKRFNAVITAAGPKHLAAKQPENIVPKLTEQQLNRLKAFTPSSEGMPLINPNTQHIDAYYLQAMTHNSSFKNKIAEELDTQIAFPEGGLALLHQLAPELTSTHRNPSLEVGSRLRETESIARTMAADEVSNIIGSASSQASLRLTDTANIAQTEANKNIYTELLRLSRDVRRIVFRENNDADKFETELDYLGHIGSIIQILQNEMEIIFPNSEDNKEVQKNIENLNDEIYKVINRKQNGETIHMGSILPLTTSILNKFMLQISDSPSLPSNALLESAAELSAATIYHMINLENFGGITPDVLNSFTETLYKAATENERSKRMLRQTFNPISPLLKQKPQLFDNLFTLFQKAINSHNISIDMEKMNTIFTVGQPIRKDAIEIIHFEFIRQSGKPFIGRILLDMVVTTEDKLDVLKILVHNLEKVGRSQAFIWNYLEETLSEHSSTTFEDISRHMLTLPNQLNSTSILYKFFNRIGDPAGVFSEMPSREKDIFQTTNSILSTLTQDSLLDKDKQEKLTTTLNHVIQNAQNSTEGLYQMEETLFLIMRDPASRPYLIHFFNNESNVRNVLTALNKSGARQNIGLLRTLHKYSYKFGPALKQLAPIHNPVLLVEQALLLKEAYLPTQLQSKLTPENIQGFLNVAVTTNTLSALAEDLQDSKLLRDEIIHRLQTAITSQDTDSNEEAMALAIRSLNAFKKHPGTIAQILVEATEDSHINEAETFLKAIFSHKQLLLFSTDQLTAFKQIIRSLAKRSDTTKEALLKIIDNPEDIHENVKLAIADVLLEDILKKSNEETMPVKKQISLAAALPHQAERILIDVSDDDLSQGLKELRTENLHTYQKLYSSSQRIKELEDSNAVKKPQLLKRSNTPKITGAHKDLVENVEKLNTWTEKFTQLSNINDKPKRAKLLTGLLLEKTGSGLDSTLGKLMSDPGNVEEEYKRLSTHEGDDKDKKDAIRERRLTSLSDEERRTYYQNVAKIKDMLRELIDDEFNKLTKGEYINRRNIYSPRQDQDKRIPEWLNLLYASKDILGTEFRDKYLEKLQKSIEASSQQSMVDPAFGGRQNKNFARKRLANIIIFYDASSPDSPHMRKLSDEEKAELLLPLIKANENMREYILSKLKGRLLDRITPHLPSSMFSTAQRKLEQKQELYPKTLQEMKRNWKDEKVDHIEDYSLEDIYYKMAQNLNTREVYSAHRTINIRNPEEKRMDDAIINVLKKHEEDSILNNSFFEADSDSQEAETRASFVAKRIGMLLRRGKIDSATRRARILPKFDTSEPINLSTFKDSLFWTEVALVSDNKVVIENAIKKLNDFLPELQKKKRELASELTKKKSTALTNQGGKLERQKSKREFRDSKKELEKLQEQESKLLHLLFENGKTQYQNGTFAILTHSGEYVSLEESTAAPAPDSPSLNKLIFGNLGRLLKPDTKGKERKVENNSITRSLFNQQALTDLTEVLRGLYSESNELIPEQQEKLQDTILVFQLTQFTLENAARDEDINDLIDLLLEEFLLVDEGIIGRNDYFFKQRNAFIKVVNLLPDTNPKLKNNLLTRINKIAIDDKRLKHKATEKAKKLGRYQEDTRTLKAKDTEGHYLDEEYDFSKDQYRGRLDADHEST